MDSAVPVLSFLGFFLGISSNAFSQSISLPKSKHEFIVIAHRGDHTKAPENTLAAFQNAIDIGADYIEIDLRTTKDSQLVIMHDATIDRMTGFKGRIRDFLWDSLGRVKVREALHPEWGLHSIPTFGEVLRLCRGKINIYLDFKEASVEAAYKEIMQTGMENNTVVYINAPHQFTEWRKIAPKMPLMISLPGSITTGQRMQHLLDSIKVDVLDGSYEEYNIEKIQVASEKNIPIWADIQSAEEGHVHWDKALSLSLAGLQSDHPGALIAYLKKKGIW